MTDSLSSKISPALLQAAIMDAYILIMLIGNIIMIPHPRDPLDDQIQLITRHFAVENPDVWCLCWPTTCDTSGARCRHMIQSGGKELHFLQGK